ncbi:MAG: rRNA synthase [Thermosediminibacterales bacterium]|jgi:23S rRNA pseudouridine1911/1915/1917 synthase|nr:rRNA synthase [Thermosediminibacterales bacterium]MDK2901553.1 rRNA synthase [Thermosediminibacterales bacterium]
MVQHKHFTVPEAQSRVRIDVFLAMKIPGRSRTYIQKLIQEGRVKVNGNSVKCNFKIKPMDEIEIEIPELREPDLKPEEIPIDIVYEDEDIIVVNKPRGMVVHPAPGNYSGTLVNALLARCDNLSGINGILRPGIVHRLDKDTSGLLLVAKNDEAHRKLAEQLKQRKITRKYIALVHGNIKINGGTIDAPIGRHHIRRQEMAVTHKNSKRAITHFKVLERFGEFTLIEASLETGRTHQIRVHMAYIGHPLVGDIKYGPKKTELKGQALHAWFIGFNHPRSGKYMEFRTSLPEEIDNLLNKLRKKGR